MTQIKERYPLIRAKSGNHLAFENQKFFDVVSPFDGKRIASCAQIGFEDAFENLKALHTFHSRARLPQPYERARILTSASQRIRERHAFFADLIAWEGGKPLRDAQIEVTRAIHSLELSAGEATRIHGREISMRATPSAEGHLAFTTVEPIGVVFAISAFNHPLNLIAHQVGPAIAAGCPVMVKPARETPLSCFHLIEELYEAGLSPEMLVPVVCENDVAEKLAASEMVSFLSFIGSAKVGWHLRAKIANGTRLALEHGGSAPAIVDESAHLDQAIPSLVRSSFYHSGQVCVSTQRIFVHEAIFEDFEKRFIIEVAKLKTGDPRLIDTDCGPIIRSRDLERIESSVAKAVENGARLIIGGKKKGVSLFEPTVLTDVAAHDPILDEEIFGPVVSLIPFSQMDEAVRGANSVRWQFQAAIYSKNIDVAMTACKGLRASAVMVNESTAFRVDGMPFRGDGPSGLGTGGIPYATQELLKEKMILIQSPALK